MCGIVGLIGHWAPELLGQLNQSLYHRGPDDGGEYRDQQGGVALAMRRLSILDLSGGHQPMSNHDGSVWIVFNGEIYNAPELRSRLEAKGVHFKTSHSDTECLLHLYEAYGEAMLAELNGMFAFVIYDRERKQIFGARDRFGIKPLYYTQTANHFAFASELKTLLQLPTVERHLNLQSLYHYLSLRYIPGADSIFKGIQRLPPAHSFRYRLEPQDFTIERYWQPDPSPTETHSIAEWSEMIRHELRGAVKRWALSDVPIGCSLSGGIDSTAIVGLLAEAGYERLSTYSLGFQKAEEADWNELPLARQMAERWGTQHYELLLTPDDLLRDLVRMVWSLDEPYGGGLPSWYIFQFMSRDVKVGLTGTGGDELFGNYGKWCHYENRLSRLGHPLHSMRDRIKRSASHLPELLLGADRKKRWLEYYRTFRFPMDAYFLYFSDATKRRYLSEVSGITDTADWLQTLYQTSGATEIRNGTALVDLQTQLPEEFLLMTDRFSMAHSLEARVPFLDAQLVDRVLSIPTSLRTHPNDLKYLLKQAVSDLLPAPLLTARKRGFIIPDTLWLRDKLRPLVERLLAPDRLARQGILRPEIYSRFVQPHLSGKADYTGQVWTLLMFQLWHVVFIEQASVEAPSFSWQDLV
ncbi:asparagine synthase (glutamine-hydrolyzing) [Stenomitos frigidus]|uniref:asparagine synthase (glutamine-hydrolyzing) n=1 Tax=Stenomitos frigidus ULC18 TaxID=2107698 RepID=A0A2T1DZR7_9CYAN|nr:asparagine synthase (glutamine-hydrolyzing) [Stenomitos frigidus]PSB25982.1 asparagine synthase (glutamine-hydrolyzing) [Stenomitos frigidus ULC18]